MENFFQQIWKIIQNKWIIVKSVQVFHGSLVGTEIFASNYIFTLFRSNNVLPLCCYHMYFYLKEAIILLELVLMISNCSHALIPLFSLILIITHDTRATYTNLAACKLRSFLGSKLFSIIFLLNSSIRC